MSSRILRSWSVSGASALSSGGPCRSRSSTCAVTAGSSSDCPAATRRTASTQVVAADLLEHVAGGAGHDRGEQRLVVVVRREDQRRDLRVRWTGCRGRRRCPSRRAAGRRARRRAVAARGCAGVASSREPGLADHLDVALGLEQVLAARGGPPRGRRAGRPGSGPSQGRVSSGRRLGHEDLCTGPPAPARTVRAARSPGTVRPVLIGTLVPTRRPGAAAGRTEGPFCPPLRALRTCGARRSRPDARTRHRHAVPRHSTGDAMNTTEEGQPAGHRGPVPRARSSSASMRARRRRPRCAGRPTTAGPPACRCGWCAPGRCRRSPRRRSRPAPAEYLEAAAADARARATRWVLDTLGGDAAQVRWILEVHEGGAGPVLVRGVARRAGSWSSARTSTPASGGPSPARSATTSCPTPTCPSSPSRPPVARPLHAGGRDAVVPRPAPLRRMS